MIDAPITELLERARSGDAAAGSRLMDAIYPELHRIAQRHLNREHSARTLQPTALVNEVFLRFAGGRPFPDRATFLAFTSHLMRNVLVDYARSRKAQRRGGQALVLALDDGVDIASPVTSSLPRLVDLDRALNDLASKHPECARSIEMRFFGGMTAEETAAATGRSIHTIQHELRFSRAWLKRRLS
jgi:RNA polymerase sigma-70 factor (ECF subfamily)